eukprot:CAMPEP_0185912036 /NCGR_PEP_ID=MMETSP0196C-20130402/35881_1 /TAXON_ID=2932 /ORGANISM="Alexandrium fundyense, Strain CCMP1719" /LENGTH=79 /DNA_ID=CAMNT_0028633193 /DNA_START=105 /DNA_END=341 /DNA_ORIENTATION=+
MALPPQLTPPSTKEHGPTIQVPGPRIAASCTGEGEDPHASGHYKSCCTDLEKELGDWDGDNRWSYRCMRRIGSLKITPA